MQLYKDLISLRLNRGGQTKGLTGQDVNVFHINNNDKMIGYHRWDSGDPHGSVVIVANFSSRTYENYSIGMPGAGDWIIRFNSDSKLYGDDFGDFGNSMVQAELTGMDGLSAQAKINVAPYSALIMSQESMS